MQNDLEKSFHDSNYFPYLSHIGYGIGVIHQLSLVHFHFTQTTTIDYGNEHNENITRFPRTYYFVWILTRKWREEIFADGFSLFPD